MLPFCKDVAASELVVAGDFEEFITIIVKINA
jgi:hypothetical protein